MQTHFAKIAKNIFIKKFSSLVSHLSSLHFNKVNIIIYNTHPSTPKISLQKSKEMLCSVFCLFFSFLPATFSDSRVKIERNNGSGVIDFSNYKQKTTTQKPKFEPTVISSANIHQLPCPGESNPDFPVCLDIRGSLRHKDFKENSVCIYTAPDAFTQKTAITKSVLFSVIAATGIIGNLLVILGAVSQRRQARNGMIALLSVGDLIFLALHLTVDLHSFEDSYDNWNLGEFGCYSIKGALIGANAFTNFSLSALFIERYASSRVNSRAERLFQKGSLVAVSVYLVALLRMTVFMTTIRFTQCVLKDNTPFTLCRTTPDLEFIHQMLYKVLDLLVFQFFPAVVVVASARFTLPVVEYRATVFRNDVTVSNAKFFHTIIIVAMVTISLSTSLSMIDTFIDLLNYPVSVPVQLTLRALPYINCGFAKPLIYLISFRDIYPRKKYFQRQENPDFSRQSSRSGPGGEPQVASRIHFDSTEMTTEEILNSMREMKRLSSSNLSTNQVRSGILRHNSETGIERSRSFDSQLNSRIIRAPENALQQKRSVANPTYDVAISQKSQEDQQQKSSRQSKYVNFEEVETWSGKQRSETHLLRPPSAYVNLGALSRKNRVSKCEENPGERQSLGDKSRQNLNSTSDVGPELRMTSTETSANDVRTSSYILPNMEASTGEESPYTEEIHLYSEIKFGHQPSVDSGCYSGPPTPIQPNAPISEISIEESAI